MINNTLVWIQDPEQKYCTNDQQPVPQNFWTSHKIMMTLITSLRRRISRFSFQYLDLFPIFND
jgi:hypothetical protein